MSRQILGICTDQTHRTANADFESQLFAIDSEYLYIC